jgi:hypothetical protein
MRFTMNTQRRTLTRRHQLFLWGIVFLLTAATPALAQLPGPPTSRGNPDREAQADMNRRQMLLRGYGMSKAPPDDRAKIQALADQVAQDFGRILILHNEIARALSAPKSLDYSFVSTATAEIKKRTTRLQSTLLLKPEGAEQIKEKQISPDEKDVKDALITLCKHIKNFVTNPVIENPGTVNVEQLDKARHDLQDTIEISSNIRKTAEKLSKSHK